MRVVKRVTEQWGVSSKRNGGTMGRSEILVYVGERTEYELPKELIRRSYHLLSVQTKDVQKYTQCKPLSFTFSPRGWDIGNYKI